MWREMDRFEYPTAEYDLPGTRYLFFGPGCGHVIGVCVLTDADAKEYDFRYSEGGYPFVPTHWMPLPPAP